MWFGSVLTCVIWWFVSIFYTEGVRDALSRDVHAESRGTNPASSHPRRHLGDIPNIGNILGRLFPLFHSVMEFIKQHNLTWLSLAKSCDNYHVLWRDNMFYQWRLFYGHVSLYQKSHPKGARYTPCIVSIVYVLINKKNTHKTTLRCLFLRMPDTQYPPQKRCLYSHTYNTHPINDGHTATHTIPTPETMVIQPHTQYPPLKRWLYSHTHNTHPWNDGYTVTHTIPTPETMVIQSHIQYPPHKRWLYSHTYNTNPRNDGYTATHTIPTPETMVIQPHIQYQPQKRWLYSHTYNTNPRNDGYPWPWLSL